ncbi:MAG: hypothetical protein ACK559_17665, partial [bacterium]
LEAADHLFDGFASARLDLDRHSRVPFVHSSPAGAMARAMGSHALDPTPGWKTNRRAAGA